MTGQSEVSTGQGVTPKNYSTWCGDCSAEITQPCLNKLTGLPIKGIHPQRARALASLKKKGKRDLQLVPKFTEPNKPTADKPKPVRDNLVVSPIYLEFRVGSGDEAATRIEWQVYKHVSCSVCGHIEGSRCHTPTGKKLMGVHHKRLLNFKEALALGHIKYTQAVQPAQPDVQAEPDYKTQAEEDRAILEHGARIKRAREVLGMVARVVGWENTLDQVAIKLVEHDVDRKILGEE